jgi:hypothetical protein
MEHHEGMYVLVVVPESGELPIKKLSVAERVIFAPVLLYKISQLLPIAVLVGSEFNISGNHQILGSKTTVFSLSRPPIKKSGGVIRNPILERSIHDNEATFCRIGRSQKPWYVPTWRYRSIKERS